MYEFHYGRVKRKYNAKVLFEDTGSLVYETETKDVYEDFYKNKNLFHFIDYPRDSKFLDLANKKVIGKMKDKFKGKIIREFVEMKSKMHYFVDFFFYLGFPSRTFTNHKTAGEGGGHFFNSSLPLPPTSQTLRH